MEDFSLLVNSIFILPKTKITQDELRACEYNLIKFVGEFEILYGLERMTFNVHILLHIVESVNHSSPLWAISAFPFESFLFVLKQYANGPKNAEQQIAKKALTILDYKFVVDKSIFHSESAKQFCKSVFSHKLLTTHVAISPYGVIFCGRRDSIEFTNPENNEILFGDSFKKCIYKDYVYKSTEYT